MANAALDRIVNNSYRVVLEGDSYRKNFTPKFKMEDDNMIQKVSIQWTSHLAQGWTSIPGAQHLLSIHFFWYEKRFFLYV